MQVPDGWKSGKFYQFVEKIYGGGTPSRDQPKYWNGTIPWVTVKDLTSQKIHGAQEYITVEGLKESASNIVPAGTVIIATRMAVGKAVISTCDVAINQDLKAILAGKHTDSVYLHYWMLNNSRKIERMGNGSTVKGVQVSDIKSLYIAIPQSIKEQQKIAQILSTWDKAIEKLEALIAAKQKRKKALMQQLLTGKKRFAGFEGKWKKVRLSDLGKCIRGVSYKPNQILNSETEESIRLLRSTNIQNGNLNNNGLVIIPSSLVKKSQLLEHGDLVLCMANGSKALVGKSAPFRTNEKIYTVGAFCAIFRPAKNSNKDLIKFLFESETYSRELKILLSGSSINNLKGSDVEAIKMFLPDDNKEQQKIASVLSAADKEIETHQKQLNTLKQQKKGLMQQLLTGQKRVKLEKAA
jgi:type I restriction enzyme S subunit